MCAFIFSFLIKLGNNLHIFTYFLIKVVFYIFMSSSILLKKTFSIVDTLNSRKKGHITGMLFAILEDFYSFAI